MQRKSISWILDFTNKLPNDEERIKCLRANGGQPILTILNYALNPDIEWVIPSGVPPYEANEEPGNEANLYGHAKKLYLFVKGGNDNLHQIKRENIFISLLSSISSEDAKLILAAKDKNLPYENITWELVQQAFPNMGSGNEQA